MSAREALLDILSEGGMAHDDEEADWVLRRLARAGYRILAPGELDPDTIEAAANIVLTHRLNMAGVINTDRSIREAHAANIRALKDTTK